MAMVAAFLFGIAGGAIGGFAVSAVMQHRLRGGERQMHKMIKFQIGGPMARDMVRELDLSPAQRERVHAILMESGARYAAVRESTRAALERELTPDQREQFRRMESRFVRHRRLEGRFPPWPPGRPHWETDTIEIEEGERR